MRLFSAATLYPTYRKRLRRLLKESNSSSFKESMAIFLNDRFGATHFLKPVLNGDDSAFLALGLERATQNLWAKENGLSRRSSWKEILLSQIEHHRAEVFYSHDPTIFDDEFLKALPGCVRKTIGWRAAPNHRVNFLSYDVLVNNFPKLLEEYRTAGARAEYFFPAYDPVMAEYAKPWPEREVDIAFTGGYSRHHLRRAAMLEAVAGLRSSTTVRLYLDISRKVQLAESSVGSLLGWTKLRRPADVREVSHTPVFGRDLYRVLGNAKIVINGAVDMIGCERGNMRCWEALGCGAVMVSDEGQYPQHFTTDLMQLYGSEEDVPNLSRGVLDEPDCARAIAERGQKMIAKEYSKNRQWERFLEIAG